ncbi:MAG: HAD family phosphatase [Roseburia sp.]|nr:HAD family phosphatase [Ruminococcus sp.]MCM1154316.1 HAD family phosphatase [Roseburia sp.]MCM1242825.1 HAD family phosphatase [Roseburia sp.]
MITTIIFDIGNVLADFTWEEHYRSLGYTGEILERITKATVKSPLWSEFDRGVLTPEELERECIKIDPEIAEDIHRCFTDVRGMIRRNDYAIPWIQELKQKGYRVLYLSNFSDLAETVYADKLDFRPLMDGGILSYEEKIVKPMPEIYKLLIDRYDLTPAECVFLDDTEKNLPPAEAFGIHTILFKNLEQAKEELRELGVK